MAPSASPAEDPPQSESFANAFVSFDGFAFEDAPARLQTSQLRPIEASVDGFGRVVDSNVKIAVKRGEVGVTVTIAGIKHTTGNTAQDVFGALLASVSMRGQPQPAAGGQAFKVETGTSHIFLTPLATEPYLLLLMVICPKDAPGEKVVEGILAALSD
jgi:hypothetical protein